VLLNAVHVGAAWQAAFNTRNTADKAFHLTAATQVQVSMMQRTGNFAVAVRSGYRAIRLPSVVPELSLVVVLPEKIDWVREVAAQLKGAGLPQMWTRCVQRRTGTWNSRCPASRRPSRPISCQPSEQQG
jgi:serine protease inhibitor